MPELYLPDESISSSPLCCLCTCGRGSSGVTRRPAQLAVCYSDPLPRLVVLEAYYGREHPDVELLGDEGRLLRVHADEARLEVPLREHAQVLGQDLAVPAARRRERESEKEGDGEGGRARARRRAGSTRA